MLFGDRVWHRFLGSIGSMSKPKPLLNQMKRIAGTRFDTRWRFGARNLPVQWHGDWIGGMTFYIHYYKVINLKACAWQPGAGQAILAPCWPYTGPMLAYVGPMLGLCWPMLSHLGSYVWAIYVETILGCQFFRPGPPPWQPSVGQAILAPCWPYIGPMLAYVGPMLAHVEWRSKVGRSWGCVGPI